MRFSHGLTLVGVLVAVGCLQVAQRNTVLLKGYTLGQRMHDLHAQETAVSWLDAEVTTLASPVHLSAVARKRQLKFVAWSTIPLAPAFAREGIASTEPVGQGAIRSGQPKVIATADAASPVDDDGTTE